MWADGVGQLPRPGQLAGAHLLWACRLVPAQDVESENVNVVKRLFKIQNLNASTIRTVMVADCSRFDSPDLLLDAGDQAAPPCRVFDLGGDSEEEVPDPALRTPGPGRAKEGLRHTLDGILDGRVPLSERMLETRVAELLAQGHTKPPERSTADARNKYLIFTTGCLTYSPHQIGNAGGPYSGGNVTLLQCCPGRLSPRCFGGAEQRVHRQSVDHPFAPGPGALSSVGRPLASE